MQNYFLCLSEELFGLNITEANMTAMIEHLGCSVYVKEEFLILIDCV